MYSCVHNYASYITTVCSSLVTQPNVVFFSFFTYFSFYNKKKLHLVVSLNMNTLLLTFKYNKNIQKYVQINSLSNAHI